MVLNKRERVIRPIIKVDNEGIIIKRYTTNTALALEGYVYNNVYRCAKGLRETHKGYKFFFEDEYKGLPKRDKVLCLDKYGMIVKKYARIEDVKYDNFWTSSVSQCVNLTNTKTRHHKGYYWCYESDYKEVLKEIQKDFILQYYEGELVATYATIEQAVQDGYTRSCIYQCLNNKAKTHAGYEWRRNYN